MTNRAILMKGLTFPESPRWRDGHLWFVDVRRKDAIRVTVDGVSETVFHHDAGLSGIGWQPDGRMLIVSVEDEQLMRNGVDDFEVVASLATLGTGNWNDMVVDSQGHAYIGNTGFRPPVRKEERLPGVVALVTPDGFVRVVADNVLFANGMVITPDGTTLILAETFGRRLTAFTIEKDGTLSSRRQFANVHPCMPDGICLDAEGAVWVASPSTEEFVRYSADGQPNERIHIPGRMPIACTLGGNRGTDLFLLIAGSPREVAEQRANATVEITTVSVPGAGFP